MDENDNVIGKATRREVHSDPSLIHRAVMIFVFNPKGELLLEKRSMLKDVGAGLWELVAGHLDSGETYENAAERELEEELGIKASLKKSSPSTIRMKSRPRKTLRSSSVMTAHSKSTERKWT